MKVLKFGGTSVGSPKRIQEVAKLISFDEQKVVVLSAMSGTTNSLVEINDYLLSGNTEAAMEVINRLEEKYMAHLDELFSEGKYKNETREYILQIFEGIRQKTRVKFSSRASKIIIGQGELISTKMMEKYLQSLGEKVYLIPALEFMRMDRNGEPDGEYIRTHLLSILQKNPGYKTYITQGFIAMNVFDEMDNLQRGGSDYTASLVGAAISAEEIQIWTDIDGMHNNDPRFVENTKPVRSLKFEEAAELAYFGAKILHPTCIQPAKFSGIPVRLKNTMRPEAEGTLISNSSEKDRIKAVAAKDGITVINITSSRMLLAYGFLRNVFEVFEKHHTSIDVICTSEVGVSVSIDCVKYLPDIVHDLKKFGMVKVDNDMCIICVVGDLDWHNVGFESNVTEAMKAIPVRMISYGGSPFNISYVIKAEDKQRALQSLSAHLF